MNRKMQKLWNYISNLGTAFEDNQLNRRIIVISNQLNYVMFLTMLLLLLTTVVTLILTNDFMSFGTLRVAVLLLVSFLNLVFSRYGYVQISRFSLIFLPPIVFLLGPTLIGYVEQESYTYYPFVLICVSIIPQLLIYPKKEKHLWWFSMTYYLLLVIFIDKVMVRFASTSFPIVDIINSFYPFYKIAQIGLFIFINASIYYLRLLNFRFEEELKKKNITLDNQNSELKAIQEEIERQKDELVRKEINTWQKLVKIISHEILNSAIPITNLAGMTAQMLEDDSGALLKPEKIGKESVEDIHHGLKVIETRTQGLVNFVTATKSLTDIPKPNIRKILIRDLFERIAVLYKPKFTESGVKFETKIIPTDLTLEADMELIELVIINLIKNALEAMKETSDPSLSLIASLNETEHIQISVSDNGEGISREVIERIFLPFYSTRVSNSGIGLSLSQQIMMLHNGRLEVTSEHNKGATFIMVF
jgi:signal transduction histidine kinase